jgi:hypothetical protein
MRDIQSIAAAAIAATALFSGASLAQEGAWEYSGSLYLFMPETNTSLDTGFGTVDSTLSFSDALDNLDFAFMGAFEASNGQWSFIGDYLLFDLSFGNDTPGPAFSGVDTSLETQIFNGYITYRVYDTPSLDLDLGGGFRWFDTELGLELLPGDAAGRSASASEDWVDPLIAARARYRFSDKWIGTAFLDYGGFSSDSETWQVLLTAGYEINANWLIQGGYRYIEVDHEIDGNDFSFDQSGPILGVTYRF